MLEAQQLNFNPDGERHLDFSEDFFTQKFVPKKLQDFDAGLYQTKWFDYRRMTPLESTIEYIKHYGNAYKDTYARELDYDRAQFVQPMTYTKLLTGLNSDHGATEEGAKELRGLKIKLSSFWKGRQIADAIGIPYNLYLDYAFEFRMRRWQRAYLPQPMHLYHEYCVEKIQERWEQFKESRTLMPEDPAYMVQNYIGIQYQNDFHEWLFEQAKKRGDEAWFLADMITREFLPIDKVIDRVDEDLYLKIESHLD